MADPLNPPAQALFDLTGMETEDARQYILSLATHLRQTEAELKAAEDDLKLWDSRVALAEQKGLLDLKTQAEAKRAEMTERKTKLELEVWEFRDGVDKLKKQLLILPATQRTVNTEALLENLAVLGGPLDTVTPTLRQAAADDALAALKKRMTEGK